jgi:hypothetical protein
MPKLMVRSFITGTAVISLLLVTKLNAQSFTLDGLARTVSAYSIVEKVCSSVIPVDRAQVQKAIEASLELGAKQFGLEQARAAVRTEVDRRSKEVSATGTLPWCSYQRDHLRSVGLGWFFPDH